ncbi:MAG: ABC transporter permease, partial [Clostridium sp.]
MLGKLIKYEIKATARILIPLYIALLVFAFINKLFSGNSFSSTSSSAIDIPAVISMIAYGCTMAAVFFITAFIMVQRFYKNLLGDEGYLMNTLPVKAWMNISSKLAVSIIWSIISIFIALLSIFIMAFSQDLLYEIGKGITEIKNYIPEEYYGYGVEFIFYSFVSMIGSALMLFLSISIGHLFSKRRILSSFGAFI